MPSHRIYRKYLPMPDSGWIQMCIRDSNIAAAAFPRRISGRKYRLAFAGTAAGVTAAYGVWFFTFLMPSWGLGINMWAVNETYKEYGYVLSTAVSFRYAVKQKPAGYGTSQIKRIYSDYKAEDVLLASAEEVALGEDCLLYTSQHIQR